jgi:tetratricopeptide (TPR) repeat protein
MTWLVLPFETRRVDTRCGAVSRQLPTLLAESLTAAGQPAKSHLWYARRGRAVAHVTLERALPPGVAVSAARKHHCDRVIAGRVFRTDEGWRLNAALLDPASDSVVWRVDADEGDLWSSFSDMLARVSQVSGLHLRPSIPATLETGVLGWVLDRDLDAWMTTAGARALEGRRDLHQPLLGAFSDSGMRDWAVQRVQELLERWLRMGFAEHAVAAAVEAWESHPEVLALWPSAVRMAEKFGGAQTETLLRRILSANPVHAESQVRLGVFLLREGRADSAVSLLRQGAATPRTRDISEAYLALALANLGREEEALPMWRRLIAETTDSHARKVAEENLLRTGTGV